MCIFLYCVSVCVSGVVDLLSHSPSLPPCLGSLQLPSHGHSQGTGGVRGRCAWQWLVTVCTTSINTLNCTRTHNRSGYSCCWRWCVHVCVCVSSPWQQCSRDPLLVTLSCYLMQWGLNGRGRRIRPSRELLMWRRCCCQSSLAGLGVYDYPRYSMVQNVISPLTPAG